MSSDLNPVQMAIRDHLARRYPSWRLTAEPIGTRGGLRYRGREVALLLREPLRDVGLRAFDDGYYYRGVFVAATSGRHITRETLTDLLRPALLHLDDAALVDTVASEAFASALAGLIPEHDGPVSFGRAPGKAREVEAEDVEAVEAFLREVVDEPRPAGEVFEVYSEWADGGEVPALGRTTFYRVAEETGLVRRVRRASGSFFLPVMHAVVRAVCRLSERAVEVLRLSGVEDPEAYAEEVKARIGQPQAPARGNEALAEIADALPFVVASAVASSADPRRSLGLVGREWADRHPETRSAIAAAADVFCEDLVEAVRFRVATAIEAGTS